MEDKRKLDATMSAAGIAEEDLPPWDYEEPLLLGAAFTIMRKENERAAAQWGITPSQVIALAIVDDSPKPLTISALARLMIQESPSVSTLIDRMYERGWVERLADPKDRRKALVKSTKKGRKLREEARLAWRITNEELFAALTKEERATLKKLLHKFNDKNVKRLK